MAVCITPGEVLQEHAGDGAVVPGRPRFEDDHAVSVEQGDGSKRITFENAIIAVGSQSLELSGMPWGDPRLMDSTAALDLEEIPGRLLVVGGSLGSQLFAQSDGSHVVFETWPDKPTSDRCSLPDNYTALDGDLHGLCEEWEKTAEMELAESVTAG